MPAELDNIGVAQTLVDLDLAAQLFLRPLLDEGALLDDLDRLYFLGLFGDQFVAASKAALAQKIALGISLHVILFEVAVLDDQQILVGWVREELRSG